MRFKVGDEVRVTRGPLRGATGWVVKADLDGRHRIGFFEGGAGWYHASEIEPAAGRALWDVLDEDGGEG